MLLVLEYQRVGQSNPTKLTFVVLICDLKFFMKKIRVLFVCLGNICRSPLAEAIFNHQVRQKGLENYFTADSCGTSDYHIGQQPDPRTLANARKNNVSINHLGRQLTPEDLTDFDYILAMDSKNLKNIMALPNAGEYADRISLMREYDPQGKGQDVPDPYFGQEDGFQEVFVMLDRTVDNFIRNVMDTRIKK